MIMLDTQVLVWWVENSNRLSASHKSVIDASERDGLRASAISIWEIAMLVSKRRLDVGMLVSSWLDKVLAIPTLHIVAATPQILVNSTELPGSFHPDPADRIVVATARAYEEPLLTTDRKILAYAHVRSVGP